jgi:hypothetical protein
MAVDDLPLPRGAPDFLECRNAYSRCRWQGPGRGWVVRQTRLATRFSARQIPALRHRLPRSPLRHIPAGAGRAVHLRCRCARGMGEPGVWLLRNTPSLVCGPTTTPRRPDKLGEKYLIVSVTRLRSCANAFPLALDRPSTALGRRLQFRFLNENGSELL